MLDFLQGLDKDIREGVLIQLRNLWTHSSTALEGNTLTLGETAFVLAEGLTISGKPLKDHEEVVGHARAINLIYDLVGKDTGITAEDLFALHRAVQVERIVDVYKPVGVWKIEPNSTVIVIDGNQTIFDYAPPPDVPALMQAWLSLFNEINRDKPTSGEEVLTAYVRLHVALVRIHPFWDGNGRIARLIANVPVIKAGLPPIIIPREGRKEYIDALSAYHLAAGQATARKELLPMADKLERFQRFCTQAWAASLKLVEDARKQQRQRSAV